MSRWSDRCGVLAPAYSSDLDTRQERVFPLEWEFVVVKSIEVADHETYGDS